jgi:hypothetical protein
MKIAFFISLVAVILGYCTANFIWNALNAATEKLVKSSLYNDTSANSASKTSQPSPHLDQPTVLPLPVNVGALIAMLVVLVVLSVLDLLAGHSEKRWLTFMVVVFAVYGSLELLIEGVFTALRSTFYTIFEAGQNAFTAMYRDFSMEKIVVFIGVAVVVNQFPWIMDMVVKLLAKPPR